LFAQEKLAKREFTGADADFVRRNIAKAELGLGDAIVTAYLNYHWSVRERHRQLERLSRIEPMSWLKDVTERHRGGVEFKLHPQRSTESREVLQAAHRPLVELAGAVFRWLEERRLGRGFTSARAYGLSSANKCPELNATRNRLVNAKVLGVRSALGIRGGHHPRERVLHALTLLLWEPNALTTPELLARLQHELRTSATTFPEMMRAYRELWARVN
jgi:hypothetical protein